MEPPGPAIGRPDDELRVVRGPVPDYPALRKRLARPVSNSNIIASRSGRLTTKKELTGVLRIGVSLIAELRARRDVDTGGGLARAAGEQRSYRLRGETDGGPAPNIVSV
jgi:hypothetical protein